MASSHVSYDLVPSYETEQVQEGNCWTRIPLQQWFRWCMAFVILNAVITIALFSWRGYRRAEPISFSMQAAALPWNAPSWLQDYVTYCREPDTDETQYLIWTCTDHYCGGVGDRLRGIFTAFYLAIATGRKFRISSTKPYELQRTLHPAHINWTISAEEMRQLDPKRHGLCGIEAMLELAKSSRDERAISVTTNAMELYPIYEAPEFARAFQGDGVAIEPQNWDLLGTWAWSVLFQPSPQLQAQIESIKTNAGLTEDYVAVHVRRGGHWGDKLRHENSLSEFVACAGVCQESANVTQVYIASDDTDVKSEFASVSSGARYDPLPPLHIEQCSDPVSDLRIWAEFMILRQARCIVASFSGYSLWAVASSRDLQSGARCWARFDHCHASDAARSMIEPVPIYSQVSANDPDFLRFGTSVNNVTTRFPCSFVSL